MESSFGLPDSEGAFSAAVDGGPNESKSGTVWVFGHVYRIYVVTMFRKA
jgi:hypothetical protein